MYHRGEGPTMNKFWKMGRVKTATGEEPLQTSTFLEVGAAPTQVTLDELRHMARTGTAIVKYHRIGSQNTSRVDVDLRVGDGDFAWTKKEIANIITEMEETNIEVLTAARRREQQRLYDETFEAELRSQIEAELREEITKKAVADATKAMVDPEKRPRRKKDGE